MNRPPDRGRGRGNNSRGRGKPKVTQAEVEAYLKAHKLQFPSLQEAGSSSSSSLSMAEVIQTEEVFKSLKTTETIMVLEKSDEQWKNDPLKIKSRYLDTMNYPVPEGKYRYIYEAILTESGSVVFNYTYDSKIGQKSPISYSKIVIKTKTIDDIKAKTQELGQQLKQKEKLSIKNPFLEISAQLRSKNPSLTDNEIVLKTMDFMKKQFLQTVHQEADDESMTLAKGNKEDNNPFTCLAGESQDPYEDDQNTPTLGDFWDSMTEIMAEKLSSNKSKEKNQ
ncbi:hypothetical protein RHMOL_Rhmol04G0280000 [Rhododendron molle]|uniref:Uncharacterized protein n=1 Tax=Rhododendron molle TaxID=49168 RepID=A0ACC0P5F3_RHOML|nr:hypothetical protein RHMOL_Rhmol04G0280000 [Rhododendron molle]